MERIFLAIVALSLIALVTAISLGPTPEPHSRDDLAAAAAAYTLAQKRAK
jgi:hypothetical protein